MSRIILCEEIGTPRARCLLLAERATADCEPECDRYLPPRGYVATSDWADMMLRDHEQRQCAGCGRWSVWVPYSTGDDLGRAGAS